MNFSLAYAQTIDPILWQTGATGLKTENNADKKTAGLAFIVQQQNWPFLSLRGGAKNQLNNWGPFLAEDGLGIELGQIKVPDIAGSFVSETADWAHNELTFSNNFKLWVSRLSPAILVQSQNSALRLFSGTVNGNQFYTNIYNLLTSRTITVPVLPKYVAYPAASGINVSAIPDSSLTALGLSNLNSNWLLVWFGNNSHFIDSKRPLNYANVPMADAFQADKPLLLVFQNPPVSIRQSPEGGIDLTFSAGAGYVSLLPLFGKDVLRASETEGWATNFPASLAAKASWWADHLSAYPSTAAESYSYDPVTDTVSILENITYIQTSAGGTTFAPLPPMLAIAKDAMNIQFSGNLVNANYPTEFGPYFGLEGTSQYTWKISGLRKYTDYQRVIAGGQVPPEAEAELAGQIAKLFDSSGNPIHFVPWIFYTNMPIYQYYGAGELYWANPAETIAHLAEVAPAVSDIALKDELIRYIRSERNSYPPETTFDLKFSPGATRRDFTAPYADAWDYLFTNQCGAAGDRNNPCAWLHYQRVPLYNFYALARYHELTNENIPSSVLTAAQNALSQDMREQDWATSFWFKGFSNFYSYPQAAPVENRHFAGLVGLAKLSKMAGDPQLEALSRALLAKAAVTKVAMAKYPRYLYASGLIELPMDPAWMPKYLKTDTWIAYVVNYNWAGPYDDARQVVLLNQFRVVLNDTDHFYNTEGIWRQRGWGFSPDVESTSHPSGYLIGFRYLVPELARVLGDFARQDAEVYLNKVKAYIPDWYANFSHGEVGREHDLNNAMDSFQTYLAQAWIAKDNADNLYRYSDVPWLSQGGDFFYLQKLAETIKAYQGVKWEDEVISPGLTGDVNQDDLVNVLDVQACVNHILGIQDLGGRADVNGDSSVDVLDVQAIVNIILGG